MKEYKYNPKPEFEARMRKLLTNKEDYLAYSEIIHTLPRNFIRCNTLKISSEDLIKRLSKKWDVEQPFSDNKEIMLVKSKLAPGELGKAEEHLLGFYYVQELSSMLSVLALLPEENERVLDLFASPGSKTTQIACFLKNSGTILANDKDIARIVILASNLERCGVANSILTRMQGDNLCERLKARMQFDKILVDAPCSGEGTLRSSPKTFLMWNKKMIESVSKLQKKLLCSAIPLLREGGSLVYSTCTHAPEENEEVVDFALKQFPNLKLEEIKLPVKSRDGILEWEDKKFSKELVKARRIYPQDNDSEGFFLAKFVVQHKNSDGDEE